MRASASMPLVSRPVRIGERVLLDGGVADAVPYRYMESLGYRRNVLVLTQPKGYRKQKSAVLPLVKLRMRKYPGIVRAMSVRHEMYNREMEEIDRREAEGAFLVIRPPGPLGIGHTEKDPDKLEQVYRVGRREAERRVKEIKAFLRQEGIAKGARDESGSETD